VSFPVWIPVGPWRLHPHTLFETLAYVAGFQLYRAARRRRGDAIADGDRWSVIAAAALGAAVGSRVLFLLLDVQATRAHLTQPAYLLSGRTIVGALVGGWALTEAVKVLLGVKARTGDLFAVPLAAAIAIGRVGCLLTGVSDGTAGLPSALPWAFDQGDGVARHPTALYEVAFLALLIPLLGGIRPAAAGRPPARWQTGDRFRVFLAAYLVFRLLVDGLKPGLALFGLTAIQWTCVVALAALGRDVARWLRPSRSSPAAISPDLTLDPETAPRV
jgi:prolipoprotein diacylglyceryltransferase